MSLNGRQDGSRARNRRVNPYVDLPARSRYVTAKNKLGNFVNYRKHLESGYGDGKATPAWRRPRHHLHLIALFAGVTGLAGLVGPSYEAGATRRLELSDPQIDVAGPLLALSAQPLPLSTSSEQGVFANAPLFPLLAAPQVDADNGPSASANLDSPLADVAPPEALPSQQITTLPTDSAPVAEAAGDEEEIAVVLDEAVPLPATEALPEWQTVTVEKGDTLGAIFKELGLTARDVHEVVNASQETGILSRIAPGQTIQVAIEGDELTALRFNIDALRTLEVTKDDDGYSSNINQIDPDTQTAYAGATIHSSFYGAAQAAGLSEKVIMEFAEIFGWDIDWANDIRKGDRFGVVFEEQVVEGEKVRDGEILAAEFVNQGKTYRAIRFATPDGKVNYYTDTGEGMRKAFIRTPVDFRRISSRFQPQRFHPVLGVKRPHRGVDFAAAVGTPVKASGDGKVIELGWKGGYGNAIVIDHGRTYSTLYGHLSKFASRLKLGDRVRQGQVIGYVGATGLATGPHLHYEFRINGVHRDPLTVKLPNSEPVPKAYMAAFKKQTTQLLAQLEQANKLALESSGTETPTSNN